MSVFFDIPKVTQIDIVSSWLLTHDVRNLDCAILNHKYRKELLDVFKAPGCVVDYVEFCNEWICPWILVREVKTKSLSLSIKVLEDKTLRSALLKTLGPTLQELELMCMDDADYAFVAGIVVCLPIGRAIQDCIQFFPALESVRVVSGELDSHFATLVQSNHKLKSICLNGCTKVCSDVLEAICRSPVLETIALENCERQANAFQFEMPAPGSNVTCTSLTLTGMLSDELTNFVSVFGNLRMLRIFVRSVEQLTTIASHCQFVATASIDFYDDEIAIETAMALATSWPHIENLEIIPVDVFTFQMNDGVAVALVDNCKALQRLVVAVVEATRFETKSYPRAPDGTSRLRELAVGELDEAGLVHILNKCGELYTLSIHNPMSLNYGDDVNRAEFALHHIKYSTVRELHLGNVDLTRTQLRLLDHTPLYKLVLQSVASFGGSLEDQSVHAQDIVELVKCLPYLGTLCIRDCGSISHHVALAVLPVAYKLRHFEFCVGEKQTHYVAPPTAELLALMVYQQYPNMMLFEVQN